MKEESIKKLVRNLAQEVSATAKKVGPDFEKERIHEFRVAVKSHRAMSRLVVSISNEYRYKLSTELMEIYHISGMIRDAQLEREKINHLDISIPGYLKHLDREISAHKKRWKDCFPGKIFNKLESASSDTEHITCIPEIIDRFKNSKLASIALINKMATVADDDLHSIRKQLKDLFYVLKIIPGHLKSIPQDAMPEELKELKGITDKIGAYNDDRIFLEHIRSYTVKSGKHCHEKLKEFMADMAMQLKDQKTAICDQVNRYVSSELLS